MSKETDSKQIADTFSFEEFCKLLDYINRNHGRNSTGDPKAILRDFMMEWRRRAFDAKKDSFYPAMRLLLPIEGNLGKPAYGLKEGSLLQLYLNVLNIPKESHDGQRLIKWREASHSAAGDFASCLYPVLTFRCPEHGNLSVGDVVRILDELGSINTKFQKADKNIKRKELFTRVVRNMTAFQQKWFVRIVLKNLNIHMSRQTVLKIFHPEANDLHDKCSNLEKVCQDLHDPTVRIGSSTISLGVPFSPMLCEKWDVKKFTKMAAREFIMEVKYDGDRVLLHKLDKPDEHGNSYRFYSRKGNETTKHFGGIPSATNMSGIVDNALHRNVTSCILDGEVVAYDTQTKTFKCKGDNLDVKAIGSDGELVQCYMVFDILYLNGENLCEKPMKDRRDLLRQHVIPVDKHGRFMVAPIKLGTSREDFLKFANSLIDDRHEGMIIKEPVGHYHPGQRNSGGWMKWKPEYVDRLTENVDVLVIGGYYGEGRRRSGRVSHFMCAVAEVPNDSSYPSSFLSFCKVGTGYTLKQLDEVGRKLQPHWRPFNKSLPPTGMSSKVRIAMPGFKERPDVWIEPENSVILEIKAAELVVSDRYACGKTLRFPRLVRFRPDKPWHQCMTTEQLNILAQTAEGKMAYSHLKDSDFDILSSPKKRKAGGQREGVKRFATKARVATHYQGANLSDVTKRSNLFLGLEICVLANHRKAAEKHKIEKILAEYGARIVQNPVSEEDAMKLSESSDEDDDETERPKRKGTFCVIAETITPAVESFRRSQKFNIVKSAWVYESVKKNTILPFEKRFAIFQTEETKLNLSKIADEYGDKYRTDLNLEDFDVIMKSAKILSKTPELTEDDKAAIEDKYLISRPLRRFKLYFDVYEHIESVAQRLSFSPLDIVAMKARLAGGIIMNQLSTECTHVVVDPSVKIRIAEIDQLMRGWRKKLFVVDYKWVEDCVSQKRQLDESPYLVRASD